MPELPEVETIVRRFRPLLEGRSIRSFSATWPRQIQPGVRQVRRAILGRTIVRLDRRGKYIALHLSDNTCLLIHLKMSGRLEWASDPGARSHVRARIGLSGDEELCFSDARKFGRIRHAADFPAATAHLGLEPLESAFTGRWLFGQLARHRRRIKPLLLDQTFIAGLGNIYSDEALFAAGIHPLRRSDTIPETEAGQLHKAIRQVLRRGIRHCGTSLDWIYPGGHMQDYLQVYGRKGQSCPRCGQPVQVLRVSARSSHFCPQCQPVDKL